MSWEFERLTLSVLQSTLRELKSCTQIEHIRFTSDIEEIEKNLSKELKGVNNNEDIYNIETFHECHYESVSSVLEIHCKSIIVSLYSFLEKALNDLSKALCRKHGYPIDIVDLKGNGIKRAKVYLEKLAEIDFSDLNSEWNYLETLNKIRNCLVHSQGEVVTSKGQVKEFKRHEIEILVERSNYPGLSMEGGMYSVFSKPSPADFSRETANIVNEINEISDRMKGNISPSDEKRLKKINHEYPDLLLLSRSPLNIVIEQDYIEYSIDEIGKFLDKIYKKSYPKEFGVDLKDQTT